jgi:putative oxidoreductase
MTIKEGAMTLQTNDLSAPSSHPLLSCTDRSATDWQDFMLLISRILVGLVFVIYGWEHISNMPKFAATMPARGLPVFMGYIAPPVELIGGLALVLGFATRYAALVLLLFTVIAAFSSHAYWSVVPQAVGNQRAHFWKNVAIWGGCLLLFITAGGRYSLDAILFRNRT